MPNNKHIHVNWDSQQQVDFLMRRITDMGLQIVSDAFGSMGADVWVPDFWDDRIKYDNGLVLDQYENNSDLSIDTSILLAFSGGTEWEIACWEMAQWYQENVHTYQGSESGNATDHPEGFECDLFKDDYGKPMKFKVYDDCTGFVSACLHYLAWKKDKLLFDKFKDKKYGSMMFYNTTAKSDAQEELKALGFEWVELDPNEVKRGDAYESVIVKGDIMCVNQQHPDSKTKQSGEKHEHHGEIYWGTADTVQQGGRDVRLKANKPYISLSWGSIHDNKGSHYGMPSPTVMYHYDACWHYVG